MSFQRRLRFGLKRHHPVKAGSVEVRRVLALELGIREDQAPGRVTRAEAADFRAADEDSRVVPVALGSLEDPEESRGAATVL
jgi:hypothetical protein